MDPGVYKYPSLYMYVGFLFTKAVSLFHRPSHDTVSFDSFLILSLRYLSLLFGLGSLILVYLIGKRTSGSALTPAPLTLPSHATIMTGMYPPGHGVRNNGNYRLPQAVSTLAELLKCGMRG
ncbi:MAG: hypothetical protein ACE5OP_06995 [Candidatus Glassbacteria bacterium]